MTGFGKGDRVSYTVMYNDGQGHGLDHIIRRVHYGRITRVWPPDAPAMARIAVENPQSGATAYVIRKLRDVGLVLTAGLPAPDLRKLIVPCSVETAIRALVNYNWKDEENDYNTEAIAEDNSRDGHIFESVMTLQAWLEATFGDRHIEPCIVPDPRENEDQETAHE
jgi:hypothetical protein